MCLNETYSRFWAGKNLSGMFPVRNGLKKGDALSPLYFNFALEYIIKRIQVNQDGLKLNSTHLLLVYSDDVNIQSAAEIAKHFKILVTCFSDRVSRSAGI